MSDPCRTDQGARTAITACGSLRVCFDVDGDADLKSAVKLILEDGDLLGQAAAGVSSNPEMVEGWPLIRSCRARTRPICSSLKSAAFPV